MDGEHERHPVPLEHRNVRALTDLPPAIAEELESLMSQIVGRMHRKRSFDRRFLVEGRRYGTSTPQRLTKVHEEYGVRIIGALK